MRNSAWLSSCPRKLVTLLSGDAGLEARVVEKIHHNRFRIQTDEARVEVSWQVTRVRHDAYANAHRIPVVLEKTAKEQGRYLHPELYGKPGSLSVVKLPEQVLGQARR
jgi:hypothetical protein